MKRVLIAFFLIGLRSFSQVENIKVEKENDTLENEVYEYSFVDEPAVYPGGMPALLNFIKKNVVYPQSCLEAGYSGSVWLKFVINKKGEVTKPEVLLNHQGCPDMGKEGVHVINMLPNWKPSKMKGKPVDCVFQLPIRFCPVK